ncbi:MAG: hypothetical protein J07AB43_02900 [Candidatus Nanosalina sp. J07AB43]|jgi:hypothetical protein|nr:MAG: hypothetical protein J07AB43_02900 [Candidatus Nanosalina sp. J07AB43]
MAESEGPLDTIEEQIQDEERSRPVRDVVENGLDKIPSGPLGNVGGGTAAGVAGYYAISTGQLAVLPIPGIKQPGYSVISHGVDVRDQFERHTVRINAASKNVAEFVAKYEVSAPSNVDFLASDTPIVSIEELKQRATFSTWEVVVDVADRGQK